MGRDQAIKVCHLISGDLWAGAEVQMYTLVKALKVEPDLQVSAIVLNPGKLADLLQEEGVPTVVIDESQNSFGHVIQKAERALESSPADLIHSHRYKENIIASRLKRRGLASRLVQTVHGTTERMSGLKSLKMRVYSYMNKVVRKRHFDRVIAVSDDIRQELSGSTPVEKLITIHNGVDLESLVPSRSPEEIRSDLGVPADCLVVGSVGRLVPIKGYDVLLKAFRRVTDRRPDAYLILAGDGPELHNLQSLAESLGISDKVCFAGFRDDIVDVMATLDIFVMSSHHEGIPMVLLEAMALRRPSVVTGVGGMVEVVEDSVSAVVVPPDDEAALGRAIGDLAGNDDRRRDLAEKARLRIEEHFSSKTLRIKVARLYRELKEH